LQQEAPRLSRTDPTCILLVSCILLDRTELDWTRPLVARVFLDHFYLARWAKRLLGVAGKSAGRDGVFSIGRRVWRLGMGAVEVCEVAFDHGCSSGVASFFTWAGSVGVEKMLGHEGWTPLKIKALAGWSLVDGR
jgi:hypothetical protein